MFKYSTKQYQFTLQWNKVRAMLQHMNVIWYGYFVLCFHCPAFLGTIDVNLPQLQYVSDNLKPDECITLVALLHFPSFEVPDELPAAERTIKGNQNCLQLLLHWNSSPGEGLGETHEKLSLRLQQMNRHDLADWLTTSVFEQLSKSLNETFSAKPITNEKPTISNATLTDTGYGQINILKLGQQGWSLLDTILFVIIVVVVCVLMWYTFKVCSAIIYWKIIYNNCKQRFGKIKSKTQTYQKLLKEGNSSGNEST